MGRQIWRDFSFPLRGFFVLIAFSIFGTVFSKFTGLNPGPIPVVASLLSMGLGCWSLGRSVGSPWIVSVVLLIGATSELIGLYTGFPFGAYQYTSAWIPVLLLPQGQNFPVQLPFAWFLVVGASWLSFGNLSGLVRVLTGATLATLIDFLMEPAMVDVLKYWKWLSPSPLPGGAHWMNPLGWFVVSCAAGFALNQSGETADENRQEGRWVLGLYCILIFVISIVG